jgi:hypothetical protein
MRVRTRPRRLRPRRTERSWCLGLPDVDNPGILLGRDRGAASLRPICRVWITVEMWIGVGRASSHLDRGSLAQELMGGPAWDWNLSTRSSAMETTQQVVSSQPSHRVSLPETTWDQVSEPGTLLVGVGRFQDDVTMARQRDPRRGQAPRARRGGARGVLRGSRRSGRGRDRIEPVGAGGP